MYRLVRGALFMLPAESAHKLAMSALRLLGWAPPLRKWVRARTARSTVDLSASLLGLRFPNPIGLAAGFDKSAEAVAGLFALGFGTIEVGTVTRRSQTGNPIPRLFRLPEHAALINRMGFNNDGAREVAARLAALAWHPAPVGVNIGKNRGTPLERAPEDYVGCLEILAPVADYLVLNASSPNTPGLRQLQEPEHLSELLRAVRMASGRLARPKPILLKIAPDLSAEAVDGVVDLAIASGIDGLVATNTTLQRPLLHRLANQEGGLSGPPLRSLSTEVIRRAYSRARGRLPIVGVGGISSGADAYEKIRAGASLVQLYTGFVYGGPGIVPRLVSQLESLLRQDGFETLQEAIGADHRSSGNLLRRNLDTQAPVTDRG